MRTARNIPQDGRIDLSFNLHWKLCMDQHRWEAKERRKLGPLDSDTVETLTDSASNCQQFLVREGREEVRRLAPFLMDLGHYARFEVWAGNPPLPHSQRENTDDENTDRYVSYARKIIVVRGCGNVVGRSVYGIQAKSEYLKLLGPQDALSLTFSGA